MGWLDPDADDENTEAETDAEIEDDKEFSSSEKSFVVWRLFSNCFSFFKNPMLGLICGRWRLICNKASLTFVLYLRIRYAAMILTLRDIPA